VLVGDFRGERRLVSDLRNPHLRVVGLWHGSERSDRPFPTVIVDARAGIHAALAHLVSLGHRRIAFVGHPSRYVIRDRLAAYQEYLADAGLPLPDGYIRHVPNTIGGGHIALSGLLALAEPPTAVMAATDFLAMDMLHAASASGLAVPEQLSIVGFDDMPFASATIPSLTTVKMPIAEMVAAGLELAVGESEWPANGEAHPPRVVFQPKLIVRRSSGRAPKGS